MRLKWDEIGKRIYETGTRNGVLYPRDKNGLYPKGVAWNGLISVNQKPSGAEPSPIYADDGKYLELRSAEEFGATIEAYTYPDEFMVCDGTAELTDGVYAGQQIRQGFGLVYRTTIGNDVEGNDFGYKLHLIYNATAAPSEKPYSTINDNPEAMTLSWEVTTVPVPLKGAKPTALLTLDSTKVDKAKLKELEDKLFGTDGVNDEPGADATLPLPDEIVAILTPPAEG